MTYSTGHPVRPVGGRLVLDFINTADWSADGAVVHEKLANVADLNVWLTALQLHSVPPTTDIAGILAFRRALRKLVLEGKNLNVLNAVQGFDVIAEIESTSDIHDQPFMAIIAASAIALLSDHREQARLKTCPGRDCGWLFIDETKNARRKWCSMESCGNRAKAARNYARRKGSVGASPQK